ncbi:MAG: signal peptidase I [Candidatus Berkelbacteria bacterium]|nr:signal peptidase I [Candidatus Berkelbacteria bacterium]
MTEEELFTQEKETPEETKKRSFLVNLFFGFIDFIKTVALIIIIAFAIRVFAVQPFIVEGQSMEPMFKNNDYLITEKILYRLKDPARGDVVIFHPPENPSINYIKRVIGLPGDVIEIKDGKVFVNSQALSESYVDSSTLLNLKSPQAPITLKSGEYYVLGDNRNHSRDSREIGAIPKQNIVSRIWFRLLPPSSIRIFARVNYDTP